MIVIENISLHFAGTAYPVLDKINYQINVADFVVVLGSNGSGKSSLLKLLDKRYQASSGNITLDNKLLSNYSAKEFSRCVKTLSQNTHESLFSSLTVYENYLLVNNEKSDREHLKKYLLKFNVNLAQKLDQMVDQLSGGEKQALALALTVLHPPRLLLLDEHTSALDPKSAENIITLTRNIIREYNITCLLTTHDLSIAEQYGNRVLALKNGKIYKCIEQQDKLKINQEILLAVCY